MDGCPVDLPKLILMRRVSKSDVDEVLKSGAVIKLTGLIIGLEILVVVMEINILPYKWKE